MRSARLCSVLLGSVPVALACGGIGDPPPPPDVAGAYQAFACEGAKESERIEACALVSAFDNGSRPALGPTGETSGTDYEIWVGPSYASGTSLERRYMSAPHKQYIDANIPYLGFREVWPDDAEEREHMEALIADSKAGRTHDPYNRAASYLHLLESSTPDYLRLIQKTERSYYLKPPSVGSCGDGCSSQIQAWVRQHGEGLVLLESGPDGVRVSELFRMR